MSNEEDPSAYILWEKVNAEPHIYNNFHQEEPCDSSHL